MKFLVIGGTGSLGNGIIPLLLLNPETERIRILSRDEHKQQLLQKKYSYAPIDFIIGDIRNRDRIIRACEGIDYVYHLAAMKHIDKCEYDPEEAIDINVIGTKNVRDACIHNGVRKAIFTTTDKACRPVTFYGKSKQLAEATWIAGNIGKHSTLFSACRYGNVFGSHGSVVWTWKISAKETGSINIIDRDMTRFWIQLEDAADFVYQSRFWCNGGELFIPRMKSSSIGALERAFIAAYNDINHTKIISNEIPKRPNEKQHECLLAEEEAENITYNEFSIPHFSKYPTYNLYPIHKTGNPMAIFSIDSYNADRFSDDELYQMCKEIIAKG